MHTGCAASQLEDTTSTSLQVCLAGIYVGRVEGIRSVIAGHNGAVGIVCTRSANITSQLRVKMSGSEWSYETYIIRMYMTVYLAFSVT